MTKEIKKGFFAGFVTALGAFIGYLFLGPKGKENRRKFLNWSSEKTTKTKEDLSGLRDKVCEEGSDVLKDIKKSKNSLKEKFSEEKEEFVEKISELKEELPEKIKKTESNIKEKVADLVEDVDVLKEKISEKITKARQDLADVISPDTEKDQD